jgi:hypothetical protein
MTELDSTLKTAVVRLLEIRDAKTTLEAEEAQLKTTIRAHLKPGDQGCVNGQPVVAVTPNRRFSPTLALETLPEPLLSLCMVTKVDSAAAKKALPPAVYEQCMAEVGEPVVRVL